jgi:hypothetical protein
VAYIIHNGAFASITFRGVMHGQVVQNTFHYQYGGADLADGRLYLADFMTNMQPATKLYNRYFLSLSSDVGEIKMIGQWIHPIRYRPVVVVPAVQTGSRDVCPTSNVACVMSLTADVATRRGVGNKHLPGVATTDMDGGFILGDLIDKLSDLGNAAILVINTGGGSSMTPVIYGRLAPDTSAQVTGFLVNDKVRVERRRTVGLGI